MTEYIWLLWDLAAAAVVLVSVGICAARGFIRTVMDFLSWLIALITARILGAMGAEFLYDYAVRDALVRTVEEQISDAIAAGQELTQGYLEKLPGFLIGYLGDVPGVAGGLGADKLSVAEGIVDSALREPVLFLLQSLCFMITLTAAMFLLRHFSRIFTEVYRVPVIGGINTLLGGIVGIVQAVLFLLLGAILAEVVVVLTGDGLSWLNRDILDETYLLRPFCRIVSGFRDGG